MAPEYDRFETPMCSDSRWPDGVPVSNWSQAVAWRIRRPRAYRGEAIHASWCAGSIMLSAQLSIFMRGLPQLSSLSPHD